MEVYTDGSCIGNVASGRFAGSGIWFSDCDPRNSSIPISKDGATHQYAELLAMRYALIFCRNVPDLTIKTDSMYSINCITKWYKKWRLNSWKKPNGDDVLHSEIIKECISIIEYRNSRSYRTDIKHVIGHSGERGNEEADRLAKSAAEYARSRSDMG